VRRAASAIVVVMDDQESEYTAATFIHDNTQPNIDESARLGTKYLCRKEK
jgi:hypothetical protein